ncbi:IucA/IucC family siderophore biosynthesis protein [Aneurinibacillus migulanus]|uniref:IucA/IucC family protein n=1 Tax=Aneurinibacillus migulanus TaxID=47500 RepID=UPI002E20768D|nr:IucA/IucC family siderophore biosynthesis protein [Aneurinibacillus migulanus]
MLFIDEVKKALDKKTWSQVNRKLLAKMLSEYMYEDMIRPDVISRQNGNNQYELNISKDKKYRFTATERLFDSFDVSSDSIAVFRAGEWKEDVSAIEFLLDSKQLIGMSSETAGHLIKELNHTLLADAHMLSRSSMTSDELVDVDYALLEGEMTGHPWITYNKGRIGFGYDDYLAFAPENQKEVRLLWIAVHKDRATFQSIAGLDFEALLEHELDEGIRAEFDRIVQESGYRKEDYLFMPIHEWQWKNIIIQNFAEDLALGSIIPLGDGPDAYLPQQSIRTFVNMSDKARHHVKLPMSILNTLVYRGLPAERTVIAPRITEYIKSIQQNDPFLNEECRVILPGEIASINYNHNYYENLEQAPYQYLEMLGTIWRESIYTYLEDGEHPITLAALLHTDKNEKPFVQSLIERSGLSAEEWMKQFFAVVLPPLLHYLYQYGTVFSPHGQNTILVLKEYKPHRLAIKDFVDDVNISDQPLPELATLTDDLKAVLRSEPPEGLTQFIFTGLFICHLRYLSNLLVNNQLLSEQVFWSQLVNAIHDYQKKFPHLQERYELFDLCRPEMTKLCLNRNRMVDYGYKDDDDRPHASEFGKVKNALFFLKEDTVSS